MSSWFNQVYDGVITQNSAFLERGSIFRGFGKLLMKGLLENHVVGIKTCLANLDYLIIYPKVYKRMKLVLGDTLTRLNVRLLYLSPWQAPRG